MVYDKESVFNGVCINKDLEIESLKPSNSFDGLLDQVDFPYSKANLLEENVETLLTIAFQHIFGDFDLMLVLTNPNGDPIKNFNLKSNIKVGDSGVCFIGDWNIL